MADYLIQDTTLDAIADAINAKTGGSSAMTPAQMVTAIGSISGGGGDGIGELLIDQTASEDVSTINLQIPSGKQNMNCYVIKLTGSTSASEWIYPVINSDVPSTSGPYFPTARTYNNAFTIFGVGLNNSNYNFTTAGTSTPVAKSAPLTNILFCLYHANSVFTSGFNVKVYGVQLT